MYFVANTFDGFLHANDQGYSQFYFDLKTPVQIGHGLQVVSNQAIYLTGP